RHPAPMAAGGPFRARQTVGRAAGRVGSANPAAPDLTERTVPAVPLPSKRRRWHPPVSVRPRSISGPAQWAASPGPIVGRLPHGTLFFFLPPRAVLRARGTQF